MPNANETGLSPAEERDLQCMAGIMIPADAALAMPGADDAAIFADMLATLGRDLGDVRIALAALAVLSGGGFSELDPVRREAVAASFLARGDSAVATLGRVVLQCYYRDDRVVQSLGLEARPPFPKGRIVEQGNWSLLDPIRNRPKLWRDAP